MSDDPFDTPEKKPAISWKGAKKGAVLTGTVIEEPTEVQERDFKTGELVYWDRAEKQPKMKVVIGLEVDGEEKNLWMGKPSAMFAAIRDALKQEDGSRLSIRKGGILKIKYTGDKKTDKGSPARQFKAKYEPPEDDDIFTDPDIDDSEDEDDDVPF